MFSQTRLTMTVETVSLNQQNPGPGYKNQSLILLDIFNKEVQKLISNPVEGILIIIFLG